MIIRYQWIIRTFPIVVIFNIVEISLVLFFHVVPFLVPLITPIFLVVLVLRVSFNYLSGRGGSFSYNYCRTTSKES
jgi:hypothetical protein